MKIKSSKGKVEITDILDLSIGIELGELCKKHALQHKCGFSFNAEINFPEMEFHESDENEYKNVIKFFNEITKLNGCCQEGYRFKVTIEQEKINLTVQKLKNMKPGERFATDTGIYPEITTKEIRWIAIRGESMHNWCIYYHLSHRNIEHIALYGDKLMNKSIIKQLVPCTDEAYKLYKIICMLV